MCIPGSTAAMNVAAEVVCLKSGLVVWSWWIWCCICEWMSGIVVC